MLSRALTILALATAARALCADPAVVRSKILAAVVAESSEECTVSRPKPWLPHPSRI